MSKSALADLSRRMVGTSKEYREKVINKEAHAVNTRDTSIKEELRSEIAKVDPELLKYITEQDLGVAASKFRATLMGLASNEKFSSLRVLESNPNIVISNNYRAFSGAILKASEAAIASINAALNENKADYVPLLNTKLIQLDHTRTVAETRLTSDIYAAGINPLLLIQELKRNKFITRNDLTEIYDNILDISSYYAGDSKVFAITGKVVEGQLRASGGNEAEGRKEVNDRVTAFKKAITKAIQSNNWADQAASDGYREYVFKRLGNAVKKAGGTSVYAKPVDTTPSKATAKTRVVNKKSFREYKPFSGLSSPEAERPLINLSVITAYINSRLPPAIRANMGSGGRLVNRTGRFSESGKVVGAEVTPKGFPTLLYTYMKSPYDVFDPVLGRQPWNTPARDPKPLIEKSIRDVAKDLAIGRFYVRRV